MRALRDRSWDGFSELLPVVGGYALLLLATVLALMAGGAEPSSSAVTVAIALVATVWMWLGWTRLPTPRRDHQRRLLVFFVGLVALATVLMLRQPIFFIFMIAGFFYATVLRPYPVAVAGIFVTSVLVNTLLTGLPTTATGWTFYLVIIAIQTIVISAGTLAADRVAEQNEQRRLTVRRLEQAMAENAGLHAQLLTQAREAGVLEERQRMAREIHDTIAQGLTGVITQLEAARHAADRPAEHERHLANAERLARDSLSEARRSVDGALPAALEAASLPDALREVARDWSERTGVPAELSVTGDGVTLDPEIEVTLLRTAQEALANVEKHAHAGRARLTLSFMGDVVTLDVRDDGVGFDAQRPEPAHSGGFGLHGMRQRVARVAGTLEIESEPGGGTAISARVPAIPVGAASAATAP
jgi:signal transduction histidine kinase